MNISKETLVKNAQVVINSYAELFGYDIKRSGGFICVKEFGSSKFEDTFICKVGNIFDETKHKKYMTLCKEKDERLEKTYNGTDVLTSWDTRRPRENEFGGAIYMPKFSTQLTSFSGLPENDDEVCMFALQSVSIASDNYREEYLNAVTKICSSRLPFPNSKQRMDRIRLIAKGVKVLASE
ncbi:MAG: hypothetical protein ACI88L_000508 [Candidatus Paceibacteria bacterium]|jgi:hypothetical protein